MKSIFSQSFVNLNPEDTLFHSMLKLSYPNKILCERIDELFDSKFNIDLNLIQKIDQQQCQNLQKRNIVVEISQETESDQKELGFNMVSPKSPQKTQIKFNNQSEIAQKNVLSFSQIKSKSLFQSNLKSFRQNLLNEIAQSMHQKSQKKQLSMKLGKNQLFDRNLLNTDTKYKINLQSMQKRRVSQKNLTDFKSKIQKNTVQVSNQNFFQSNHSPNKQNFDKITDSPLKMTKVQKEMFQKQQQVPKFVEDCYISLKNRSILINFFKFLANANYKDADIYLQNTIKKSLFILQNYKLQTSTQGDHQSEREIRTMFQHQIFQYFSQILDNNFLSESTRDSFNKFLMDQSEPLSFISLIKSAINNELNLSQKDGILKSQMVISQLQLIGKIPQPVKHELLECILIKLQINQFQPNIENVLDQKIDILDIFKVPNRQIMLLLLTEILERKQFKIYRNFQDTLKTGKQEKQIQNFGNSEFNQSQIHQLEAAIQFQISNQNVRDIMSICLKAVSHYFDGKKSFETLCIYLKLAFKVFVCVGIEGSQTILAGRSMSEFLVYFIMKSLNSKICNLDRKSFSILIELCIGSMKDLLSQISQEENLLQKTKDEKIAEIIRNQIHQDKMFYLNIMDTLTLFSLQFNGQNQQLFEILSKQNFDQNDVQYELPQINLNDKAKQLQFNSYKSKNDSNEKCIRIFKFIKESGFNQIIFESIKRLIMLELEFQHKMKYDKIDVQLIKNTNKSKVQQDENFNQNETISLKYFSNLVNHFNNFKFTQENYQKYSNSKESSKIIYNERNSSIVQSDIVSQQGVTLCSLDQNFKEVFQILIQISNIFIDVLKKYSIYESEGRNRQLFDFSIFKQNVSIISQKLFQSVHILGNQHWLNLKEKTNESVLQDVSAMYFQFVLGNLSQFIQKYERNYFLEFFQEYVIEPLTKQFKRIQNVSFVSLFVKQLEKALVKNFNYFNQNQFKLILEQTISAFLELLTFQQNEANQELLSVYISQNHLQNVYDEKFLFTEILQSICQLMKLNEKIELQNNKHYQPNNIKNSSDFINLWAIILVFVQRKPENLQFIQPYLNQISNFTPCMIYDQDFTIKIKQHSSLFKDIEDIVYDRQNFFKKYPQLQQSLNQFSQVKNQIEKVDNQASIDSLQVLKDQNKNKFPQKNEMLKKIELAKIKKYLNMIKEAAVEQSDPSSKKGEISQKEEQKKEEQLLKEEEDLLNDDQIDPNLAQQLLNTNEIIFVLLFIVIQESRLNDLQNKLQSNIHENVYSQNFIESSMIVFNSQISDQENILQKLESVVKTQINEYIAQVVQLASIQTKSTKFDVFDIVSRDIQILLKARIHNNQKLSNVASYTLRVYIHQMPLILKDFEIFQTLMDCIQSLNDQLNNEYDSLSKVVKLQTLNEYVFLPSEHEKIQALLQQYIHLLSDLYLYSQFNTQEKLQVDSNFKRYKSLLGNQKSDFCLKIFYKLKSSFTFAKWKQSNNFSILEMQDTLIFDPKQLIDQINQVKQINGQNAFYFQDENFGMDQNATFQDKNFSFAKITPFQIYEKISFQMSQNELTFESIETQQNQSKLSKLHKKIQDIFKNNCIENSQDSVKNIQNSINELWVLALKQIQKIDILGQIQYIQKHFPIEMILSQLTKKQLDLKSLQIECQLEIDQERYENQDQFLSQADEKSNYLNQLQKRIKMLQFVEKSLQIIDKENFIKNVQVEKLKVIVNTILKLINDEEYKKMDLEVKQVINGVVCLIFTVLESSVAYILFEVVDQISKNLQQSQKLQFWDSIHQNLWILSSKIDMQKSLSSQKKRIKQSFIQNHLNESLNQTQQENFQSDFFSNIFEYDYMHSQSQNSAKKQNLLESYKTKSSFNQQIQSSKILKYIYQMNLFIQEQFDDSKHQKKVFLKIIDIFIDFNQQFQKQLLKLSHKSLFLKTALSMIRTGLLIANFSIKFVEKIKAQQGSIRLKIQNIIQLSLDALISLISKYNKIILRIDTISNLRKHLQIIEDIKYLILKVNNPKMFDLTYKFEHFQKQNKDEVLVWVKSADMDNTKNEHFLISKNHYSKLGIKQNFIKISSTIGELMQVTIKGKYYSKIFQKSVEDALNIEKYINFGNQLNNLLVDQLNYLKYSLMGTNFFQKQMMEVPVKQIPNVSMQAVRDKPELFLYNKPKLLLTVMNQQSKENLQILISNILKQQIGFNNTSDFDITNSTAKKLNTFKILDKIFWKSEIVLDILMKQAIEIKDIQYNIKYKSLLSLWRNTCVSMMVVYFGYKYSNHHFLHAVSLKPFYYSSSKTIIFYLSQFFQSMRWDSNFQLQKFLFKKSKELTTIAHNVIWFCRVESHSDPQPQRKVPLPVPETIDYESKKLENLIMNCMSEEEQKYFETETTFLEKITSISGILKPSQSKDEKKAIIREKLIQYNKEIPENVYLPTNQRFRVVGIVTTSGMPMQSAARVPILVSFEVQEYQGPDNDQSQGARVENKSQSLKQYLTLQNKLSQVSECLMEINQISIGWKPSMQKLQKELRKKILIEKLSNYHEIQQGFFQYLNENENMDLSDQINQIKQKLKQQNQKVQMQNFEMKNQSSSIRQKLSFLDQKPLFQIKLSQYNFQNKNKSVKNRQSLSVFSKFFKNNQIQQDVFNFRKQNKFSSNQSSKQKNSFQRKNSVQKGQLENKNMLLQNQNIDIRQKYTPSIFQIQENIENQDAKTLVHNIGLNLFLQFEQNLMQSQLKQQKNQGGPQILKNLQSQNNLQKTNNFNQTGQIKDLTKPIRIISCIFKVNDDLRQDILALQFIKFFQKIFKKNELDLFVAPYKCISNRTGQDQLLGGIIEVVPNSNSRDQIGKAFEIDLYDYFLKKYGNESSKNFMIARQNFIRSLSAYSVVSYILQIKDRHNGNILVDDQGHLIHIDFGFIFDWSPGKDMRFESANFKMTKEFIKILGGSDKTEAYQLFVQKTIQGYLAVREHHREFMNLVELMIYSGFPCFKQISLQTLQQRFKIFGDQACSNQFEAAIHMRSIIQDAHDKWTTTAYDMIQYKQNKIAY